ncbi:hypothetical protein D7Y24_08300 [Stenotrophomonas maltophilia]|nr:hypothetical protein [Stenotrophomonas maltophilia]MBA0352565.1 hypothetical protein [Stenotrophomonas maltophilia]
MDGHGNGLRLRLPGAVGQRRNGTLCFHSWHGPAHVRNEGDPDEQLGVFHTDGLIVAARQLVREAHHCLSDDDA